MLTLRPYQLDAIEKVRESMRSGRNRIILHAPTGAGKTVIACEVVRSAVAKGSRTLFLAHRKELIDQASAKFDDSGIPHGIIMRDHPRTDPHKIVQVASVQTLIRRDSSPFDLIIVDECHRANADSYQAIIAQSPKARVLGLTATPCRTDGRGLRETFEEIVPVSTVKKLTKEGFLVPVRHFAPDIPDLEGLRSSHGDYNSEDLESLMDQKKLVGDIVKFWQEKGENRQTIIFAVGVEHSKHLAEQFSSAGVPAEHLDAETPIWEREMILERFRKGQTKIVSNCGILTEGYDNPSVSCVILARPTQSLGLYLQMAGRSLRPSPGKMDTLIFDHAACGLSHGLVTDDREWMLEGREKKKGKSVPSMKNCPQCFTVFPSIEKECPTCGYRPEPEARELEEDRAGKLVELTEEKMTLQRIRKMEEKNCKTLPDWQRLGRKRGYKSGWAYIQFSLRKGMG